MKVFFYKGINAIPYVLLFLATGIMLMIFPVVYFIDSPSSYEVLQANGFRLQVDDQFFLIQLVSEYVSGVDVSLVPFSGQEITHLSDVRAIVMILQAMVMGSGIVLLILLPYTWFLKKQYRKILHAFFFASVTVLGVYGFFAVYSAFSFSDFFTQFHYIFFPQGGWEFPEKSLLVNLFPQWFFYYSATYLLQISIVASLVTALGAAVALWYLHRQSSAK